MVAFVVLGLVLAACSSTEQEAPANAVETSLQSPTSDVVPDVDPAAAEEQAADGLKILAHRGVHQTFSSEGVDDETCTATRIDPVAHDYIENTIPSMEAAFGAGATVVEIDIAATSDGVLAVFHDWEVGCRTNGSGDIRSLTWDELSTLDIGHGYTTDGETFSLRGKGQSLMPRLEEVFAAFPNGQFLINFKSGDPAEAILLQDVVQAADAGEQVWAVYGAPEAVDAYVAATDARGFSEASIRACLGDYLAAEDNDVLLDACVDTVVAVPLDIGSVLPGWPHDFVSRMEEHGTDVIISGPDLSGIDTRADFDVLPQNINAYVWTNKIRALAQ